MIVAIKQALALGAVMLCVVASGAQSQPAFEVVSIHRNVSGGDDRVDVTRGRVTIHNASLRTLVRNGYDIQSYQFGGEPSWIDGDRYDISATIADHAEVSQDEYRALIRSLLADRFQLKVHWETRQGDVYALVVAKNGPAMKVPANPSKEPGLNTDKSFHRGQMVANNAPMLYLTSVLSNQLSHPVVDKTGLQGQYDWTLVWDPNPGPDSTEPSLFTAVQEQLGLKLKAEKGPVKTLVIDSVVRPSEN